MPDQTHIAPHGETPGQEPRAQARRHGMAYWLLSGLLDGLLALLAVVLLAVVLLQTNWGAEQVRRILERELAKIIYEGSFRIGHIDGGNLFAGVLAHDIVIEQYGQPVVFVDSMRVAYELRPLLGRRVYLQDLYLSDLRIAARQAADQTWNLTHLFVTSEDTTVVEPWSYQIDVVAVRNGTVGVHFYAPDGDSILVVNDLNLRMTDALVEPDTLAARMDTLYANLSPPNRDESWPLALSGGIGSGVYALDTLRLETPRTDLTASGRLVMTAEGTLDDLALDLRGEPLALADVRAVFPALQIYGTPTLAATITNEGDGFVARARAQLQDGGALAINGRFDTRRAVVFLGDAELRRFDLGAFVGQPEMDALLNADLSVNLQGERLETVDGPVNLTVFNSRYAGQRVTRAALDARFTSGTAALTLNAAIPGANVSARGSVTPFIDVPAYDLAGQFRDVNLATLTGNPEQQGVFNGTFAVDGRGIELETANTEVRLTLDDSRYGDMPIDRVRFTGRLNDGTVRGDLAATLAGGSLSASGTMQPFLDVPRYDLDGRFNQFNLATFSAEGGIPTDLTGSFSLRGSGFDLATADATVRLALADSRVNELLIEQLAVSGRLRNNAFSLNASASIPGGDFTANGTVRALTGTPRYDLTGSFNHLDLAGLGGEGGTPTDLTGTFAVTGSGTDPQAIRLDGELNFAPSTFGDYQITDAVGTVSVRGGTLGYNMAVDFGAGGQVEAAGTARPFDEVISYNIEQGRLRNVDVGYFMPDTTTTSDLNGTFSLTGSGTDPQTLSLNVRLNLTESRYNEQMIERGTGTLALNDGLLRYDVDVLAPEGQMTLAGTFRPFDENPSLVVEGGRVQHLDLGLLLGNPDLSTSLTGEVRGTITGFDPATGVWDIEMDLERSRINRATVEEGTLRLQLTESVLTLDTDVTLENGRLSVEAQVSGMDDLETVTYTATGTIRNADPLAFTGVEDTLGTNLNLAFDVTGTGLDPNTMEASGTLQMGASRLMGTRLDTLATRFAIAEGTAVVDTLVLRSRIADATGGGVIVLPNATVDRASDFRLQATVRDLTPIQPLLGANRIFGEGEIVATYSGPRGQTRLEVLPDLRYLTYNDYRLADLSGRFVLFPEDSLRFDANLELGYFSSPTLTVQRTDLAFSYNGDEAVFRANIRVDQRRDAVIAGRADLLPGQERVILENLNLRFEDQEWTLLQEASIAYGEVIRFRNFLLHAEDQQIAIDGSIDPDGPLNLVVTAEGVQIGNFTDLFGYTGVNGQLDGNIVLGGTAQAPVLEGRLTLDDLTTSGQRVGALQVDLAYENLLLELDALLTHEDGSRLTATGTLPIELGFEGDAATPPAAAQAAFTVQADSFAIGWLRPFLPPESVDQLRGRLDGTVQITGTRANPEFEGSLRVVNGVIGMPALGLAYDQIGGDITFSGDVARFNRLRVRSPNAGDAFISGTLSFANLTPGDLDLTINARNFRAIDTEQYQVVASGNIFLRGPFNSFTVSGNVTVEQADINLQLGEVATEAVQLTERDRQMLLSRFGVAVSEPDSLQDALFENLALALDVRLNRNVWIHSRGIPTMHIEVTGDVNVVKSRGEPMPQLFGTLSAVAGRSRVEMLGRRFVIEGEEESRIVFNGDVTDAYLNVRARLDLRRRGAADDIGVYLVLEGRADELQPRFESSGADLTTADMLAYIISGRPAEEGFLAGGADDVAALATSFATGELSTVLEGLVGGTVGLDVVEIDYDPRRSGIMLVLGEYLTSRLYGSVSVPLNQQEQEAAAGIGVTMEYQLYRWLLSRFEYQEVQAREENVRALLLYLVFTFSY